MERDGGRGCALDFSLEILSGPARNDSGRGHKSGFAPRSGFAALRPISVEFPRCESPSEDTAPAGLKQQLQRPHQA
jgi:hypothetical protein